MVKVAPSILTADVGRLADQVKEAVAAGAEVIHLDVMDGHFVPPITLGPLFVAAVRKAVSVPLDIHLMVSRPEEQIAPFRDAGGDILSFHYEATPHPHRLLGEVRRLGALAGICLNPGTPVSALADVLPEADQVVVMTVNPGWGGQPFIEACLEKVKWLAAERARRSWNLAIEVDGGVNLTTAPRCVAAGADVLVAGAAVYNDKGSVAENIGALLATLRGSKS
ncbi:MAG TPA: ribulose-phosphate 3-epimerase [Dehalococcoidia bacterium]|nr:ribulose-phosphate 3-epimerase [Dehalococcoidia bacterium]